MKRALDELEPVLRNDGRGPIDVRAWYGSPWDYDPPPPAPPDDKHQSPELRGLTSKNAEVLKRVGLTLGRFRPPHHGHVWLVEEAFAQCGWLHLVTPRQPPGAAERLHSGAVLSAFARHADVHIVDRPKQPELPASWASIVRALSPAPTHLFSCDPGAQSLADALGLQHHILDESRKTHRISASMIRYAMVANFHLIAPPARHHFAMTVGVVGAEGSGKSTLCRELSSLLQAPVVDESLLRFAREAGGVPLPRQFELAMEQTAIRVAAAAAEADTGVVISDDNVLVIDAWARRLGFELQPQYRGLAAGEQRDLWLLCHNDFPYSGARDEPTARRTMFEDLRHSLRTKKNVIEISGDGPARVERAATAIKNMRNAHLRAKAELLR